MKFSIQSQVPNGPGHRRLTHFVPRSAAIEIDLFQGLVLPVRKEFPKEEAYTAALAIHEAEKARRLKELFSDAFLARTPLDEEAKAAMPKPAAGSVANSDALAKPGAALQAVIELQKDITALRIEVAKVTNAKQESEAARSELTAALEQSQKDRADQASKLSEQGKLLAGLQAQVDKITSRLKKQAPTPAPTEGEQGEGGEQTTP